MTKKDINDLSYNVIGAAIEVHKFLGPGLLENVYHKCMEKELNLRGLSIEKERIIEFDYKGLLVNGNLRADIIIENTIVAELKSVETIHPVYQAQLLSYMKLLNIPKGILINFNVSNLFKYGQKTYVNELFRNLADH